jgi:hypothetical protein
MAGVHQKFQHGLLQNTGNQLNKSAASLPYDNVPTWTIWDKIGSHVGEYKDECCL